MLCLTKKTVHILIMVLVTGGTGLLGSTLLYQLAKKGESIVALKRKYSNLERVKNVFTRYSPTEGTGLFDKIQWIDADISDTEALQEAIDKGVDQIYHCTGHVSFMPHHKNKLEKINHKATEQLVNLALANKIKKFCYVSSIATINQANEQGFLTEKSDFDPKIASDYAITKYMGEREVWRGAQEGLDIIIVKPGVILASDFWDDSSGTTIAQALQYNYATNGSTGFVDVRDVAKAMVDLMESNVKNESFVLTATNTSFIDFTNKIREKARRPAAKIIPSPVLKTMGHISTIASKIQNKWNVLPPKIVESLLDQTKYDNSKIKKTLEGFSFLSLDESLDFHVKNYLEDRAKRN